MYTNKYQITNLKPEEWKDYKSIRLEALKNDPQAFITSFENASKYTDEKWKDRLTNNGDKLFFLKDENQIIGMAGYFIGKDACQKHIANIVGVYISPKYRGLGLSKLLLSAIIYKVKADPHIKKLSLGVISTQSPAIKLYTSLGFEPIGTKKKESKINGVYYDEILMEMFVN